MPHFPAPFEILADERVNARVINKSRHIRTLQNVVIGSASRELALC